MIKTVVSVFVVGPCRSYAASLLDRGRPVPCVLGDDDDDDDLASSDVGSRWAQQEVRVVEVDLALDSKPAENLCALLRLRGEVGCVLYAVKEGSETEAEWQSACSIAEALQSGGKKPGLAVVGDVFDEDGGFSDDDEEEDEKVAVDSSIIARLFGAFDDRDRSRLEEATKRLVEEAAPPKPIFASLPLDALLFDASDVLGRCPRLEVISRATGEKKRRQRDHTTRKDDIIFHEEEAPSLMSEDDAFEETDPDLDDDAAAWRYFIGESDETEAETLAVDDEKLILWRDKKNHRLDRPIYATFRVMQAAQRHADFSPGRDQQSLISCSPFQPMNVAPLEKSKSDDETAPTFIRFEHVAARPGRNGGWTDDKGLGYGSIVEWMNKNIPSKARQEPDQSLTKKIDRIKNLASFWRTTPPETDDDLPLCADDILVKRFNALDGLLSGTKDVVSSPRRHHHNTRQVLPPTHQEDILLRGKEQQDPVALLEALAATLCAFERRQGRKANAAAAALPDLLQLLPSWSDDDSTIMRGGNN